MLDLPRRMPLGWAPLVEIVGADLRFKELYSEATEDNVLRFLMVDPKNPGSILSSLHSAREILRVSRDTMPRDTWERLNDLFYYVNERGESAILRASRQAFVQQVISSALLVYSVLTSNMSRDVGFQFLRIGTNIEQADMTTRILDVRTTKAADAGRQARSDAVREHRLDERAAQPDRVSDVPSSPAHPRQRLRACCASCCRTGSSRAR